MVDLRTAAAQLIENPVVPVPPVEGVVARARRYRAARVRRQAGAGVLILALAVTAVVRAGIGGSGPDSLRVVGDPVPPEERPAGVHVDRSTTTTPWLPGQSPFPPGLDGTGDGGWDSLRSRGPDCPMKVDPRLRPVTIMVNKDARAPSADEVEPLAVVKSVVDYYNFLGGICGRAIELVERSLLDDVIPKRVVGLVGTPLDPAFDWAAKTKLFDDLGLPAVGGDGLTNVQHESRLVYPVGTSAEALTRIALDWASGRGARSFAIVYDGGEAFSREAVESFHRYTSRIGGTVREAVDVSDRGTEVTAAERFRAACDGGRCDFVLLALRSDTGDKWLQTRPPTARVETAALPTLLTGGVPESCFRTRNERCDGITAWTGFTPWFRHIEHAQDLRPSDLDVTEGSALTEATGLSARVLVEALLQAGPKVDRKSLRSVLETTAFSPAPDVVLQWGSRLPRAGNPIAQRWRMDVEGTAAWAGDAQGHTRTHADEWATWTGAVAAGAQGVPSFAEALGAYGQGEMRVWVTDSATPQWKKGEALPSPPSPPPSPPHAGGPPMSPDVHSLRTPLPDKWWSPEGDWRRDPGWAADG